MRKLWTQMSYSDKYQLMFYVHFHARIHTCFHRFTEIGQIFRNRYIFNKEKLSKLQGFILGEWNRPIFCLNDS